MATPIGSMDEKTYNKKKTQLSGEKTQLSNDDMRREEIIKWLNDKAGEQFQKGTIEKLTQLFMKYNFQYSFNRQTIAGTFQITENAASRIIRSALEYGIIYKEKNGIYYFVKPE